MNFWKKGLRVMAYLKPELSNSKLTDLTRRIQSISGVENVRFVSKKEAFSQLKAQMKRQASLFDNLVENPLPNAFEIQMNAATQAWDKVEFLAAKIEALDEVQEVEYGQRWLGRYTHIFNLFKLTGYAMCGIFFMAAVFIVANTIRLVIYSRRDEIEIMRLVGAAERFIKVPFYFQGLLQGALGASIGLAVLFFVYLVIASNIEQGLFSGLFQIRFLSPFMLGAIILLSMLVGWFGSYLALKQYLKV
jgi:cell division transport system permease protein